MYTIFKIGDPVIKDRNYKFNGVFLKERNSFFAYETSNFPKFLVILKQLTKEKSLYCLFAKNIKYSLPVNTERISRKG